MKLKYMLRGLGIGVIITACIMGAYTRSAVADARVAVLKEYGFGDEPMLIGETQAANETPKETAQEENVTSVRNDAIESEISSVLDGAKNEEDNFLAAGQGEEAKPADAQPEEPVNPESPEQGEQTLPDTGADAPRADGDGISVVISNGDDSGTVARKLYNAGLIENAAEYDAFLMQHGYDKKIKAGEKTIYAADSWQEIAEKISSK